METLLDLAFDGRVALERVIAASEYRSVLQAVAAMTGFSHPETVAEVGVGAVFRTVRGNVSRRGEVFDRDGRLCAYDDNKSPTDAFLWANGIKGRPPDVQFNHVYQASADADCYTALPNLCVTPTFLAKLTDTDPLIRAHLRYRVWELYGWAPAGADQPEAPSGFSSLVWAAPLPHVGEIEKRMRAIMARRPKDRTVRIALAAGWCFSDYRPDSSLGAAVSQGRATSATPSGTSSCG